MSDPLTGLSIAVFIDFDVVDAVSTEPPIAGSDRELLNYPAVGHVS